MKIFKTIVTAPRFAHFGSAIREFCFRNNLIFDIMEDKRFFSETVYVKIHCPDHLFDKVSDIIIGGIKEHNGD